MRVFTKNRFKPIRCPFFITDRHFIATLKLDPDDPDWERIGRDWVKPSKPDARERLYAKLIRIRSDAEDPDSGRRSAS